MLEPNSAKTALPKQAVTIGSRPVGCRTCHEDENEISNLTTPRSPLVASKSCTGASPNFRNCAVLGVCARRTFPRIAHMRRVAYSGYLHGSKLEEKEPLALGPRLENSCSDYNLPGRRPCKAPLNPHRKPSWRQMPRNKGQFGLTANQHKLRSCFSS